MENPEAEFEWSGDGKKLGEGYCWAGSSILRITYIEIRNMFRELRRSKERDGPGKLKERVKKNQSRGSYKVGKKGGTSEANIGDLQEVKEDLLSYREGKAWVLWMSNVGGGKSSIARRPGSNTVWKEGSLEPKWV